MKKTQKNPEAYYKKMTETPVPRLIVSLGIPTTISMLITNVYNMADTYFVGSLGESPQAATGVLFTLQAVIQAIGFMLAQGAGTMISRYLADKDTHRASVYASTSFFLGGALALLLTVLGFLFLDPFMILLGSTDTILPYARDYGMWVLISAPFMVCSFILNSYLRYEGRAFYSMLGICLGGLLNIFDDWVLIRRYDMGVYGAGLSTAVSQIISFVVLFVFYTRMAQSRIHPKYISKKLKVYFTVCRVGFPALIRQGLTSISNGLLNNLTKPYGDTAIAAMSVVNRFSAFVMCVGLGIGQGYQPVAAFNYQAKKYRRVKRGLVFTMIFGFCLISLLAIPGFIFADGVVSLFQKSEEVREIGKVALRYASVGIVFLSLSVPINMLYQSIRKVMLSSVLSLMRAGAAFIPTLLITTHLFGLKGIQISQPIADIVTGLFSIPFILHFLLKTPSGDEEVASAKK